MSSGEWKNIIKITWQSNDKILNPWIWRLYVIFFRFSLTFIMEWSCAREVQIGH